MNSCWRHRAIQAALEIGCLLVASCSTQGKSEYPASSTYGSFVPLDGTGFAFGENTPDEIGLSRRFDATPTRAPLSVNVPERNPNSPLVTPTPDSLRVLPTIRNEASQYLVEPGDTLGSIAQSFGVGVNTLSQANGLTDADLLSVGQVLDVPPPYPDLVGTSFKILPDSELVYGPSSAQFDINAYVQSQSGYLAGYTQVLGDKTLTGPEIISLVSQNYSVNPRLLLAILEHRSHWVTKKDPAPTTLDYPLGLVTQNRPGLYQQLTWAANELNRGFYLWRVNAVGTWVLHDGSIVPIDATINAGTAGVQNLFSTLDDRVTWDGDVSVFGLFQTYFFLFGNPFDFAIEPIAPTGLTQPLIILPFERGATWAFTGGPHAAWDSGSAWAALDFAPSDVMLCTISEQWITAVADGFIVRASDGSVVQDLDGDGYEQTGWNILYLHVFNQDRVEPGTYVLAGDRIGHPSCEGGISNAAHLHIARKYNGEWISADGPIPIVLSGWRSLGSGVEYNGYLKRGNATLEALEDASERNLITR